MNFAFMTFDALSFFSFVFYFIFSLEGKVWKQIL